MLGGLGVLFWLAVVIAVVLWAVGWGVPVERRWGYWGYCSTLFLFALILVLGWKVFGPPFHLNG